LGEWFSGRFGDAQIEYAINHVHLWDALIGTDVSSDRAEPLRDLVADVWRWWLPKQSEAAFEVWTASDGEEYGPTVGFGRAR
jgi:hypothetical protein